MMSLVSTALGVLALRCGCEGSLRNRDCGAGVPLAGEEGAAARRVSVARRMEAVRVEERRKRKVVNKLKGESSKVLVLQAKRMWCYLQIWENTESEGKNSSITHFIRLQNVAEKIPILKLRGFLNILVQIRGACSMLICSPLDWSSILFKTITAYFSRVSNCCKKMCLSIITA